LDNEQNKERYRCRATVRAGEIEIKDVLCKIFLPVKTTEPVLVHFHPSEVQLLKMEGLWKFSMECEFLSSPDHLTKIYADKVYTHRSSTEFWQPDIAERIVVAQPEGLRIDTLRNVGDDLPITNSHGRYWLTPSKLLSPAQSVMRSFTGEVEVKTVWQTSFTLKSGLHLTFANRYRYRKNVEGETVTYKELVAEFEVEGGRQFVHQVEEGTHELDDLLVLTSFAERQRCLNLGYDTSEIDGTLREYYRGNVAVPEFKGDRNNLLIKGADFNEFLQIAYNHFTSIESVDLVRQAINYVIPSERGTVQSIFISLYSALETIVLYLRRQANLEFIFSGDEVEKWKKFKNSLRKFIEQHPLLESDKAKQILLKKNITALQRISFAPDTRLVSRLYH